MLQFNVVKFGRKKYHAFISKSDTLITYIIFQLQVKKISQLCGYYRLLQHIHNKCFDYMYDILCRCIR